MIPKECKRLAEVDFPIAAVSRHAVREKPIVRKHPQSFHQWWARRPLASSRAMLLALLLPDPCDRHCPEAFKAAARRVFGSHSWRAGWAGDFGSDEGLRRILLNFIADFANWDRAADPAWLAVSRALVRAAHGEEAPLVVDPFAGGGSIPLEALRLGCEAFASDLNPVACLILKVMLEDIPRHGPELAKELRRVGSEIKHQAEQELADLYPTDVDGATPIAYLWARTVRCEAPGCGAEIPLLRSFWLCKKPKRKRALRFRVERPAGLAPRVGLEVFQPKADTEVPVGTVTRARATCSCCTAVLPPERVRMQLAAQKGGADVIFDDAGQRVGGARMTAVVTLRPGRTGRYYRLATDADYEAVHRAQERVTQIVDEWNRSGRRGLCPVPDEPTPAGGGSGAGRAFSLHRYGMFHWGDLFTARQKATLFSICSHGSDEQLSETLSDLLGFIGSRLADRLASLMGWDVLGEKLGHVFNRQALPLVWDFAEGAPFAGATGSHESVASQVSGAVQSLAGVVLASGQTQCADAADHPLPDQSAGVWFTDPPYYDAIPYSDLSDFFLVWLKRALPGHPVLRDPFDPDNPLSPKTAEAVQDETKQVDRKPKDRAWFEEAMARAFAQGRRVLREDGIGSVVFAHKTTEGWEALLSGMIRGGWTITGSWPIATERPGRLRSRDSAALATSVHLVCRPRSDDAPVGDWAQVLRELPRRVAGWMERLQDEGIRGADLVFACVGPALEIFSRYTKVETAEGRPVELGEYLEKVWEVVGRAALQQVLGTAEAQAQNGLTGALEEDARLTALFLWTLQNTDGSAVEEEKAQEEAVAKVAARGFSLPFDVVRRFAQPMGIDLDAWSHRIIGQNKGVVRLLPVAERGKDLFGSEGAGAAADWIATDPSSGVQPTLFPELRASSNAGPRRRGGRRILDSDSEFQPVNATTLDRLHAAMLLQANGHANALRTLIGAEQERGPDFLRLANALSALYPRGSSEKRLLDAMLLAVPR